MTCEECEQILLDSRDDKRDYVKPKGWLAGISVVELAKAHAQECQGCAAKILEISKVDDALDQLRSSTLRVEAPPKVEARLLVEFRRRAAVRIPSGVRADWSFVWGTAVALIIIATGFMLYTTLRSGPSRNLRAKRVVNEQPAQQQSSMDNNTVRDQATIVEQRSSERPKVMISKRNVAKADEPRRQRERGPALPSREDLALNGGGNVVRVTLPLASLAAMGIPMHPEVSDGRVTADVMIDPFGAVLAVHLVEVKPTAN